MTSTAVFSDQHSVNTTASNSVTALAHVAGLLRKSLGAVSFTSPIAVKSNSAEGGNWMTTEIRRNMTTRAQRLMRADY